MNKTAIKNFAIWARNKLIADIVYRAGLLGVTEKGIANALPQSTREVQFFDIGTKDYMTVRGNTIRQRDAFVAAIKAKQADTDYVSAFRFVVEKVAYTWFNRLIAIRFMEVNDYLPSRVRVLSSENPGKAEPDMVTRPFDTDISFSSQERDEIIRMKDENRLDELFRMLFIKQCQKLNEVLPGLFEAQGIGRTDSYLELLLTISFTDKDGILWHLTHDIAEGDFNVEKEGQIEIIGWMYQYYNTEPKDHVFANLKKNIKISKDNIPAATQLFTPDWIVRYMVENSLGRLWVEGHPNDELKKNWKYYLEEAKQDPQVQAQIAEIHKEYSALRPEDLRIIDPCMGSGHILVYLFDVLMQIYESQGWAQREAAQSIVQNNLFGLDIDDRAAQLAYFAVMMKARQYDRRFLEREIAPHLYGIQESNGINRNQIKLLGKNMHTLERNNAANQLNTILDILHDAKEYGSILNVPEFDWDLLHRYTEDIDDAMQITLDTVGADDTLASVRILLCQAQVMSQKYNITITNPPYMGSNGMDEKLSAFIRDHYPDSKGDMSTVCMERCLDMCTTSGFMSMINIPVWMFLSTYERLRYKLLDNNTITNLVHPGRGIFGSDFGTTTFVISKYHYHGYIARYSRLFDKQGDVESIETRERAFLSGKGVHFADQDNFRKIPGAPIAYWVGDSFSDIFVKGIRLEQYANARQGMKTLNNERFLRLWFEVDYTNCCFNASSNTEALASRKKWFPLNHGGDFRKYYGNNSYLVNWGDDGKEIKELAIQKYGCVTRTVTNIPYYFKQGITWTVISSASTAFRRYYSGHLFSNSGQSIVPDGDCNLDSLCALLNSKVINYTLGVLSPTLGFESGYLKLLPIIQDIPEEVSPIAQQAITISKDDWDSFETSWDFKQHPFVWYSRGLWDATAIAASIVHLYGEYPQNSCPIEICWLLWQGECNERFSKLKENEETINQIFINIYGLQDELTSEVEEKEVTVRKADLNRDIRSFISYAVGCMFGRYSLDIDGLAYAGGDWDDTKYQTFLPDPDNCLPITDEVYFEDDIVGRFVEFVRVIYGSDSLENNLTFIANALGNKGNTSRDVIRNYFLNDFFKDHCATYSVTGSGKRPIYWLFDSGKQNGFKALVYMHRWDADTVGNLRVEYLHRMQRVYEKEIERMQDIIDNSRDNREVNQASKRREKLVKQLKEARDYDAKIAHAALSRVEINLDDGVKTNYEKVQKGSDGKSLGILAKI